MRFICGFLLAVTTVIPVSAQTTISGSWSGLVRIQEQTLHLYFISPGMAKISRQPPIAPTKVHTE